MATQTATIKAQGRTVRGVWTGGAYIDLHFVQWGTTRRFPEPFDVMNVYNYATGQTDHPFTPTGLKAALAEWRSDLCEGELDCYAANVSVQAGGVW